MSHLTVMFVGAAAVLSASIAYTITNGAWQSRWDAREAMYERSVRRQQEDNRATEQKLRVAVDIARQELDEERNRSAEHERSMSALRLESRGLRASVERLRNDATGSSGAADDTLSACQSRSRTLTAIFGASLDHLAEGGQLLAETAELARRCAIDHDRRAAEVEALIKAWPSRKESGE